MTAKFRVNSELRTWELKTLEQQCSMKLPHPIKRLYGVHDVDEKFWGEKE